MGINGPWLTKSYLEMILERKGQQLDLAFSLDSLFLYIRCWFVCSNSWLLLFPTNFIPIAGVPRLNTPPLLPNTPIASNQERVIAAPKPIRTTPNLVTRLEDLSQPWTRSPTKSKMEPVLATWHFISSDPRADNTVTGMSRYFGESICCLKDSKCILSKGVCIRFYV